MNWIQIETENVIRSGVSGYSSLTEALENSDKYPGIIRDADGVLEGIYLRPINAASQRVEAVDFNVSYDFDTDFGAFMVGMVGTYTGKFKEQLTPSTPVVDRDGTAQGQDTWKVIPNVQWNYDGWTANVYVNHTSGYSRNDPASPQTRVDGTTMQGRRSCCRIWQSMPPALCLSK